MRNMKMGMGVLAVLLLLIGQTNMSAADQKLRAKFLDVLKNGPALLDSMEKLTTSSDKAAWNKASTKVRDDVDRFLDEELDDYLIEEKTLTKAEYDKCVALQKRYADLTEARSAFEQGKTNSTLNSPSFQGLKTTR